MSSTTLRNLIIVLAAAIAVYVMIRVAQADGGGTEVEAELATVFAAVDTAALQEIEIVGDGDTMTLRRLAKTAPPDTELETAGSEEASEEATAAAPLAWTVDGYPADSTAVRKLLDALAGAEVQSLASTNPENHRRLGVGGDSAWHLSLEPAGGEPVRLIVGEAGPGFRTTYVRLLDNANVYVISTNLHTAISHSRDEWRDPTIVRLDTAAVERLVIEDAEEEGGPVVLARAPEVEAEPAVTEPGAADDGDAAAGAAQPDTAGADTGAASSPAREWHLERPDGPAADSAAVRRLLSDLAPLEATGFAADTATVPESSSGRVVALGADGDTLVAVSLYEIPATDADTAAAAAPPDVWARVAGDSTIFELSSWRADNLTPARDELAADTATAGNG